ncbi:cell division protein ZipA [Marinobacter salicampi]|uniref:cell division protein ZipA n=1 Tax=Marinobacter salicampi TaxID=435907 RepID=UPI001407373F|nr:cell division protein ZipA [Marinobacter salicampi]
MSLREWLIAIGILVILGIVIDGIRRMRRARKDAMTISSGMGADDLDESPLDESPPEEEREFNPELPNGGARPVDSDTLQERGYFKRTGRSRFANPEPKPTRPVIASRDKEARSEHEASLKNEAPSSYSGVNGEDTASAEDFAHVPLADVDAEVGEEATDTGWGTLEVEPERPDEILGEPRTVRPERKAEPAKSAPEPKVPATSEVEEDTARRGSASKGSDQPLAGANRPDAQEVIVINVLARRDQAFSGPALKKLFEACGLQHGDMDIYHRHEEPDTNSPVQFSVANAVEPGTFHPDAMASMSTPGISFFMSMPGPSNSMQAFDFMLETAQCVVHNLGGELKDERRSVMTAQTIEHCRQRVREYERKRHTPRR